MVSLVVIGITIKIYRNKIQKLYLIIEEEKKLKNTTQSKVIQNNNFQRWENPSEFPSSNSQKKSMAPKFTEKKPSRPSYSNNKHHVNQGNTTYREPSNNMTYGNNYQQHKRNP